jgi:preprotein translocase YajC subunit
MRRVKRSENAPTVVYPAFGNGCILPRAAGRASELETMNEIIILAVILVLGLGAYWSLVIFPRQREFQKQQRYVRELHVGDEMITFGGIIGKVMAIDADAGVAEVEVAPGVTLRVVTAALMRPYDPAELADSVQKALGNRPPEEDKA